MKKCPNCQKTYEDNLKYCQSDGTPLVVVAEDKPPDDPYKTMVASDLKLPDGEPASQPEASEPSGELETASQPAAPEPSGELETASQPAAPEPSGELETASQPAAPEPSGELEAASQPAAPEPSGELETASQPTAPEPSGELETAPQPTAPEPSGELETASQPAASEPSGDFVPASTPVDPESPVELKSEADAVIVDGTEDKDGIDNFLEVPEDKSDVDPMKTMVVSGSDTSNSIKIPDLPEAVPEEATSKVDEVADDIAVEQEIPDSEAATIITPEIPKFSEPDIEPPDLGGPDSGSGLFGEKTAKPEKADSKSSVPIPSPFDESMPPGYALPENPPFEEGGAAPPASPFSDKQDLVAGSAASDSPFGSNAIASSDEGVEGSGEGDNKTLAIVSLISGIVGVLCCAAGILFGPVALITGYMAKGKITMDPAEYGGATFANVGMGLGILGILLSIIVIVLNLFSIVGSF